MVCIYNQQKLGIMKEKPHIWDLSKNVLCFRRLLTHTILFGDPFHYNLRWTDQARSALVGFFFFAMSWYATLAYTLVRSYYSQANLFLT